MPAELLASDICLPLAVEAGHDLVRRPPLRRWQLNATGLGARDLFFTHIEPHLRVPPSFLNGISLCLAFK